MDINGETWAELIFPHVTDSVTWCRLTKVNKRFNRVSKRKIINKEIATPGGILKMWQELPTGIKHGEAKKYIGSQMVFRCNMFNNHVHGQYKAWHTGTDQSVYKEGNAIYGTKHGLYREWYSTGQLHCECNFSNGNLHGLYREWYPNGKLYKEANYLHDQLYGVYREWYENSGKPMYEFNYENGLRHGRSKSWDEDSGCLIHEYNFWNGELHGLNRKWNINGELEFEENYNNGTLIEKLNN